MMRSRRQHQQQQQQQRIHDGYSCKNVLSKGITALAFLNAASAFTVMTPSRVVVVPSSTVTTVSRTATFSARRNTIQWMSSPYSYMDNDEDENEEDEDKPVHKVDDLYEFLTRREQKQQTRKPDIDRTRKRDRVMKWMGTSESSSKLVQPLSVEDGSVMGKSDEPPRGKSSLDSLFEGMPTLDQILTAKLPTNEQAERDPTARIPLATPPEGQEPVDDSWFDQERSEIEQDYETILQEMKEDIRRRKGDDSIPENAEGIVDSIIQQEMKRTIDSERRERAAERLQGYEQELAEEIATTDFTEANDELSDTILKEAEEEYDRRQALEQKFLDFASYEKRIGSGGSDEDILPTNEDTNLDEWALQSLEKMLTKRLSDQDDDGTVSDILEQNISDLKMDIEKQAEKGSIKPETMKEWQMYRSIASRMARSNRVQGGIPSADGDAPVDERVVAAQLDAWKQYTVEEEDARKRSGLSRGPKMPFDWNEAKRGGEDSGSTKGTHTSRREARRDINIQSIQAMEDLIANSDPSRARKLQEQLDELRTTLESSDYYDIDEQEEEKLNALKMNQPIDLSDVFSDGGSDKDSGVERPSTPASSFSDSSYQEPPMEKDLNYDSSTYMGDQSTEDALPSSRSKQVTPNTPFFQNSQEEDDEDDDTPKVEAPNSPFYSDDTPDELAVSKLGTLDEQKLRMMYRRAGAKTTEDKEELKAQWMAFQEFERNQRQRSGLSQGADSEEQQDNASTLKYEMSDVIQEDGDVDAAKILAAIGPRPSRTKKSTDPAATASATGSASDVTAEKLSLDPEEISESLYRSVSAIGGGRTKDDPSLKEQEKADFEAYLQKENELRGKLDSMEESETSVRPGIRVDDEEYANEALASIGPRPTFVKRRSETLDAGEYSDMGGALTSEDDDDDDDDEDDEFLDIVNESGPDLEIPDWLKNEQKKNKESGVGYGGDSSTKSSSFLGDDIDEVFDDDKYDHDMRQLAEYQRRRSGQNGPTGIDIKNALGRGSDDYADYTYDADYFRDRNSDWGAKSVTARKAHLLDYTELSTIEVNNLVDHKNSVYATGVSQYMPRINKPFKEFGAIVRLEGILVDTTGLHLKAWRAVAEKFSLRQPTLDDVRRASVTQPELAIWDIFYWSKDIFESKEIVEEHRRVFQKFFDEWAQKNGVPKPVVPAASTENSADVNTMALGSVEVAEVQNTPVLPTNEQARLSIIKKAWEETAALYELSPPPFELVVQSTVLPPDITVQSVFRWSTDSAEIDEIVTTFRKMMMQISAPNSRPATPAAAAARESQQPTPVKRISENTMLELQYKAWCKLAKEVGVDEPEPEAVVAAAVLNDPTIVILEGFEWTEDLDEAEAWARRFQETLTEIVNFEVHGRSPPPAAAPATPETTKEPSVPQTKELTQEDRTRIQTDAWAKTAAIHNFAAPTIDQIQLTMQMRPDDSVRRLLAWTHNFNDNQIRTISATYENALKGESVESLPKDVVAVVPEAKEEAKPVPEQPTGPTDDELFKVAFDAWTAVAQKHSFDLPDNNDVILAMSVGPEEAIVNGFRWADTKEEVAGIAKEYREQIASKRSQWQSLNVLPSVSDRARDSGESAIPDVVVIPGVDEWIKSLANVEMGCGMVSYLSEEQVAMLLDYAGATSLFPRDLRVTADNRYDRDSQQLLGAALRIERRPDHCIVFDTTPYAAAAAQEVEMRSVAFVGPYPRYDLLAFDTSAVSFTELTAMNIRRLFGERVYDQPELDMLQNEPAKARKVLTRFWDDE